MNNSPINSTINSTTVVELADASSLSCFSRHFYVVNLILLSVLHLWTNFDEKKFYLYFKTHFLWQ